VGAPQVALLSPGALHRAYVWGATLGLGDGLAFEPRILWPAALMHDVGLTRISRNTRCFEFQSADVARRFLEGEGMPPSDAARVALAIELHMAPSVTLEDGVESLLLGRATAVDVRGTEFERIDAVRETVMRAFPRGSFDRRFVAAMRREVAIRPGCQNDRLVTRIGAATSMAGSPWERMG
jgi:HD superfamily phosphodiesterase